MKRNGQGSGAPISFAAAKQFISRCAVFDLYAALVLRAYRGERWPLPLFERGGLCDIIGFADADFKVRQDLRKRLAIVRAEWPQLPYYLDHNTLVCHRDPGKALAAHVNH